jgi:hypothetical protein
MLGESFNLVSLGQMVNLRKEFVKPNLGEKGGISQAGGRYIPTYRARYVNVCLLLEMQAGEVTTLRVSRHPPRSPGFTLAGALKLR